MPLSRVIRSLRQSIPPGVVIGRRAGTGVGPAELLLLSEALSAQLDSISNVRGSVLYRGATGWQGLLPGTTGQALVTNGPGADPIWSTVGGGNGWFYSPPTLATLSTIVAVGSGTTGIVESDDADIGFRMRATINAVDEARLRLQTLGTLPKTVTARFLISSQGGDRCIGGICLRNSTTGQRVVVGHRSAQPVLFGLRQATGTTFNSAFDFAVPYAVGVDGFWVRIVLDASGNASIQMSADGKDFNQLFTRTASQVAGAGVDQVGIGITAGDPGAKTTAISCQYFTVT